MYTFRKETIAVPVKAQKKGNFFSVKVFILRQLNET